VTGAHAPEYVGRGEQSVGQDLRIERVPLFAGNERRLGVVRDLQVFADVRVCAQRDHRHVHFVPYELDVVPRVVRQVSFQAVPAHVQDFLPDVPCNSMGYGLRAYVVRIYFTYTCIYFTDDEMQNY